MPRAKKRGRSAVATRPKAPTNGLPTNGAAVERELEVHREELAAQNEELRRANTELTTVKERYAQLFDVAPIGYFTLDDTGRVVEVNVTGAEMLGTPRSALFGASFDEHLLPSKREAFRALRRRVHETGRAASLDTVLVTPSRRFHAHVEAAPLGAAGFGARQCILCVGDETARRRTELERRAFEARLAEAHRRESLGLLAGSVARDFDDILGAVLAHVDLALANLGDAPARADVLAAKSAASRAAELSRQMLAYAGRGTVRTESVDVATLVRAMESLLRASVQKNVAFELDLASDLPLLLGDPVQLQQIVMNLVLNASEAIGDGKGRVVVRACAAGEKRIALEVTDDGPGMSDDTQRSAFDPFFSTKTTGRGLGLAVVQGNVAAHDGTVTLASAPGRGTTIRIELPAAAARM